MKPHKYCTGANQKVSIHHLRLWLPSYSKYAIGLAQGMGQMPRPRNTPLLDSAGLPLLSPLSPAPIAGAESEGVSVL